MVRVNDARQTIKVAADKETLKNGPTFDDDREITPELENEVYSYYGLRRTQTIGNTGSYGSYYSDEGTDAGTVGPGMSMGDTETGEFREHAAHDEGVHQSRGDDLEDEDELRVQRTEEELVAGIRQREAGSIRVRKRVRTDRGCP
jgi:stress response protein YsnF